MIYLALLRGINVGGKNSIKMNDLKVLFHDLGFTGVQTYIQSGNVIFHSEKPVLAYSIEAAIEGAYGFSVPVLLIDAELLEMVLYQNPFLKNDEKDPSYLHVTFFEKAIDASEAISIPAQMLRNDQYVLENRMVYLYCPDGYGKTKLNNGFWEKRLGCKASTRNWKTVGKLYEMMQQ